MQTKHTLQSLKDTFKVGFIAIFKISPNLFTVGSALVSFIISIILFVSVIWLKIDCYLLIINLKDLAISILPNILGFTIGGYGFLIGFNQANLINRISEPVQDSKYSLYQIASASFAACLIIQAITLLFSYVVHVITYITSKNGIRISTSLAKSINYITLFIILILLTLSLAMVIQIVLNIFNFSQLIHYNVNKGKVDSSSNNNSSNP